MPRISKLSIIQLESLKIDLSDPRLSQQSIAIKFHIAPASVFYYKKKFAPTVARIYSLPPEPPKPKIKQYEDYLREYYARIGKPYVVPPILGSNAKYLSWL